MTCASRTAKKTKRGKQRRQQYVSSCGSPSVLCPQLSLRGSGHLMSRMGINCRRMHRFNHVHVPHAPPWHRLTAAGAGTPAAIRAGRRRCSAADPAPHRTSLRPRRPSPVGASEAAPDYAERQCRYPCLSPHARGSRRREAWQFLLRRTRVGQTWISAPTAWSLRARTMRG